MGCVPILVKEGGTSAGSQLLSQIMDEWSMQWAQVGEANGNTSVALQNFICQRNRCNDLIDVAGASNFQMEMRHLGEKYDLGNAFMESVQKEMFVRVMSWWEGKNNSMFL